ncbi:helix-turn-helix domain-containing protein, partial [Dokdonella sp.]|uniref:helix-turn-helix domain-containing protein n=1 Tax=Dokdonella sp. TaxID=2291710 RepID=UPI0039C862CF
LPRGARKQVNAVTPLRPDGAQDSVLQPALSECVARAVRHYLADIDAQPADGLHALVISEVESPLLREVLDWCGGNQSRAAATLGINRATLRKKLQQHGLS